MPPTYASTAAGYNNHHRNPNQQNHAQAQTTQLPLTPTAMGRWSVSSKQLPPADQIKALHVYDFDNTRESAFACQKRRELPSSH